MKSLIEENNQIPEMYLLRHQHDGIDMEYDYVSNTLDRAISPVLKQNDIQNEFIIELNKMYSTLVDSILPIRNIFYWSYNKYYNKHGK